MDANNQVTPAYSPGTSKVLSSKAKAYVTALRTSPAAMSSAFLISAVVVAFFLAVGDFGRRMDHQFPACALILLFMPGSAD